VNELENKIYNISETDLTNIRKDTKKHNVKYFQMLTAPKNCHVIKFYYLVFGGYQRLPKLLFSFRKF